MSMIQGIEWVNLERNRGLRPRFAVKIKRGAGSGGARFSVTTKKGRVSEGVLAVKLFECSHEHADVWAVASTDFVEKSPADMEAQRRQQAVIAMYRDGKAVSEADMRRVGLFTMPIFDVDGKPCGRRLVVTDPTERREVTSQRMKRVALAKRRNVVE